MHLLWTSGRAFRRSLAARSPGTATALRARLQSLTRRRAIVTPKHRCLVMPIAYPSPRRWSLHSARGLFRLSFPPCFMGGKTGRFALSGCREYAAFRVDPPAPVPPAGGSEEELRRRVSPV